MSNRALIDQSLQVDVAFALVLLKLKPHSIAIEDYILTLRTSLIVQNHKVSGPSTTINCGTLWHSLFEIVQRRNLELQVGSVAFESNSDDKDEKQLIQQSLGHKRKEQPWSTADADIHTKRRQIQTADSDGGNETELANFFEPHQDRTLLLRVISNLARSNLDLLYEEKKTNSIIQLACNTIIETCKVANDSSIAERTSYTNRPTLYEACIAARKMWSVLISRIEMATRSVEVTDRHATMYAVPLCSVIKFLLGRLDQYCFDEVKQTTKMSRWKSEARNPNVKATLDSEVPYRTELFNHRCGVIAATLAQMLDVTNKLQHTALAIVENVSSVLLEHLGSSMSLRLFGDPQNSNKVMSLAPPPGFADVAVIEIHDAMEATRLEAPFLITSLKGLMCGGNFMDSPPLKGNCEIVRGRSKTNGALRKRLQRVLVRGIFGEENTTESACKDNQPQAEILEQNYLQKESLPGSESEDDWLLSQVWELLGWDFLMMDDLRAAFP